MQEEQLLKSNIDYEARLKDHLYQFEEEGKVIWMNRQLQKIQVLEEHYQKHLSKVLLMAKL